VNWASGHLPGRSKPGRRRGQSSEKGLAGGESAGCRRYRKGSRIEKEVLDLHRAEARGGITMSNKNYIVVVDSYDIKTCSPFIIYGFVNTTLEKVLKKLIKMGHLRIDEEDYTSSLPTLEEIAKFNGDEDCYIVIDEFTDSQLVRGTKGKRILGM
jgi:hypothetical protein